MAGRVGSGDPKTECRLRTSTGFTVGPAVGLGATFCLSSVVYYLFHAPFTVKILSRGAFTNRNTETDHTVLPQTGT